MEVLAAVLMVASFGAFAYACAGLIRPKAVGLPNRVSTIVVWMGSVLLLMAGGMAVDPEASPWYPVAILLLVASMAGAVYFVRRAPEESPPPPPPPPPHP